MALNITDGYYVYMRNPVNEDAGPLYAYTAMPSSGLRQWYPRESYDKVEMERYFGHTCNLPLCLFPAQGTLPMGHADESSYMARHQLYDIIVDPQQTAPLYDPEREAYFAPRIAEHLRAYEAPSEQHTQLSLEGGTRVELWKWWAA